MLRLRDAVDLAIVSRVGSRYDQGSASQKLGVVFAQAGKATCIWSLSGS